MNLNDRNVYTNRTDPEQNPHYPRLVTDRADQLLEELDAAQIMRLYSELKTMSYVSWNGWFLENTAQIGRYDDLSDAQRQKILSGTPSIEQLLSHHACVFVELLRARIDYRHQLRHSELLKTDSGQRSMAMMMIDAYEAWHPADLWAFDHPEIHDHPLFADDD